MTMQAPTTLAVIDGMNTWLKDVNLKPGNSNLAPGVDWLYMFILYVCIISFVLLMVPMFYWAWRWRRKPGVAPIRTPNHNTLLEVTWVVVPLIVVTFIFFYGFWGYIDAMVTRGNQETINIKAQKWSWDAMYKNGAHSAETVYLDDRRNNGAGSRFEDRPNAVRGNNEFPVFVVPRGIPLTFKITSSDVMHSFYIPDMRLKIDAFPNRTTSMTFTAMDSDPKKSGAQNITQNVGALRGREHYIFCAEYCGDNHSEMAAILRVLEPANYEKVIAEWGNLENILPPDELGAALYTTQSCKTCHSIEEGVVITGPSWKGFYGKDVKFDSASGKSFNLTTEEGWDDYIAESIRIPQAKIHAGFPSSMPPYTFTDGQIKGIQAYIRKLNGKSRPEDHVKPEPKKPATP